jgi:hypothetical protein
MKVFPLFYLFCYFFFHFKNSMGFDRSSRTGLEITNLSPHGKKRPRLVSRGFPFLSYFPVP